MLETGVRTKAVKCFAARKVVWHLKATNANAVTIVSVFVSNDMGQNAVAGRFRAAVVGEGVMVGSPTGIGALNAGGLIVEMWPEFAGGGGIGAYQAELRFSTGALMVNGLEIDCTAFGGPGPEGQSDSILMA